MMHFRSLFFSLLAALAFGAGAAAQSIPAFPGAEGFGALARGGRGGDVYYVTNLNASGAGSLANGIATVPASGRTIVFAVSGHIPINGLRLTGSKVTIAGQTAPGDGVGLINGTFRISGDDVVVRHLRFRHRRSGSGGDCINLDSGSINSVLDHCTLQFSTDENMSSYNSPPENVTFQWSINAWGLESHSCGGLWDQNHATAHHTLWAHNHTRNPKARPGLLDWINNVTFDWDIGFIMGDSQTPANWRANVRGNYFLSPPGNLRQRALEKAQIDRNGGRNFSLYMQNNLHDADGDGLLNGTDKGYGIASGSYITSATPFTAAGGVPVTIDDPLTGFKKVVSNAGALRLNVDPARTLRDDVDAILMNNVLQQRRMHVSNESQTGASNGGIGTLNSAAAPVDTDRDGMPDYWETALGWNVAAQDHNTAMASSGGVVSGTTFFPPNTPAGYTRLEEYLHFLAIPHGLVPKNAVDAPTFIDVDLRKFTSGFVKSPVFTLTNTNGGTTAQSGPGGHLVRFTPTQNLVGRAKFDFTVQDSDGSNWRQTCAILVTSAGIPRDLVWKGTGNVWDTAAANWLRPATNATVAFSNGDRVAFDQSGLAQPNVSITGALVPTTVEVSATGNYTLSGPGSITSTGTLTKRGTGTVTLAHAATFSGGGTLEAGTVNIADGGSLAGGNFLLLDGVTLGNVHGSGNTAWISAGIEVPAGNSATVKSGNRLNLSGPLTGAGTLDYQVQTTVSRADLSGPAAAFAGKLNLTSNNQGGAGVRLFFNGGNFNGFNNSHVELGAVSLQPQTNSGGNTLNIGALSSTSAAANLAGGSAGAVGYVIGARGIDTSFAGTITGNATLTKTGPGTLTLGGANTYTGATNVNAGWLLVDGSLGSTAVTVVNGAFLGGRGTIGGNVTANAGATLSPGTQPFTGAPMNVNGNLTLSGNTLFFDLSSSPAGANDRIVMNGGTMGLAGTQNFQFLLLDGSLSAGTYDLITGGGSTTASGVILTHNLPAGARQSFTLTRSGAGTGPAFVRLTVAGNPATLTWTGSVNTGGTGNWDATTPNWSGGSPNTFFNFDAVTFLDTAVSSTVNIVGNVAPRSVRIDHSRAYSFGGTGAITGPGALLKSGPGTLTMSNANSYSGGTTIDGGVVQLANDSANANGLGTGPITLLGGTLAMHNDSSTYNSATYHLVVPAGRTASLHADSRVDLYGSLSGDGVLNFRVPFSRTSLFADWSAFTGTINVVSDADGGDLRMSTSYSFPGFPRAAVALTANVSCYYTGILAQGAGTTIEIGELSGPTNSWLRGGSTGGRSFTYRIGGRGTDATFSGTFEEQNTGTTTALVKTGTGVWTLGGTSTYRGSTIVEQGTLRFSGSLTNDSSVEVQPGATLSLQGGALDVDNISVQPGAQFTGHGNVDADLNNDGNIQVSSGTLTVNGDVVNNGTMRFTGGSGLAANGAFINNGLLDLLTSASSLPANLENNGVVLDRSNVRVESAVKNGTNFTVTVASYSGHIYQLQRADSVSGPWQNVGTAQAGSHVMNGSGSITPSVLTFTDAGGAGGGQKFYRVLVGP